MWHAAGAAEQLALRCKVAVVDGRKRSRGLAGTEVAAVAWVPPNFKLRHVCNASELFLYASLASIAGQFYYQFAFLETDKFAEYCFHERIKQF